MMCATCWADYGSPALRTPEVGRAAKLVAKLYDGHTAGGYLHIVTDDWNLEDGHVEWVVDQMGQSVNETFARPPDPVERECADSLLVLSIEGRASALALAKGFTV